MNPCITLCREGYPCQPWYCAEEFTTKKILDIPATFGPGGICAFLFKLVMSTFVVGTQFYAWSKSPDPLFYYAYYTSWALLFATLYATISTYNTINLPEQTNGLVQGRTKYTWVVFNIAIFSQCLATIIFWAIVYDWETPLSYLDVATHGGVFAAILVDGMFVSRIPLRWMHFWLDWGLLALYLIWTVIHGPLVLDLGNPNSMDTDDDTNDDGIYAALSWQEDNIKSSLTLVLIVGLIVAPVVFGLLRTVSISFCGWDRRRYLKKSDADVELGSYKSMQK
mmetsp:Transcript_23627/g.65710  ORF Transcript_23627/g.65710 Transcript_23627/m.65710 type:complete len:280 (+) Transcript_23627:67-906(+)|eukprot:CAMPEP_0168723010 /NCGR_PEP_ID=MMETSP0724-20121128/2892_1 /TAXON_ID=265536 /ORGANISM="Amphiprora sp., Strain CCMP467" /LENGTH=279 /DNA_ID=CAMNT_0008769699 /DNA_START=41 /DNA_END=880 /DNA_ORIENTATION=-